MSRVFPVPAGANTKERATKMAEDGGLLWVGIAHGIGVMLVSERVEAS